jgi:hypothetical protein
MPLTSQPTRADQPSATGIGRAKSDDVDHPATDLDVDYPAAEHEKIKDFIIDVCDEVGNHSGTTGSLNSRVNTNEGAITALQVGATTPADVDKSTALAGSSTHAARVDHKHSISTASPANITGRANAEGSATSLARSDHAHALAATVQSISTNTTLATTTGVALIDTGAGGRTITLPDPATMAAFLPVLMIHSAGSSTSITLARHASESIDGGASNRIIISKTDGRFWLWTDGTNWFTGLMFPTDTLTNPATLGATGVYPGGSSYPSPADHVHNVSVGTPVGFARANAIGSSSALAAADHQHDAGDVTINYATSATTALGEEDFLNVDTSGGNVSITLPNSPSSGQGRKWTLYKTTTDSNKITISPPGAQNVQGANAAFDLPGSTGSGHPSWTLLYDTNNDEWWVL